jgi:hypothetical protein
MSTPTKILFISADPTNATRLRLGEEMREVRERLQLSRGRDEFVLVDRQCVRPVDLTQAIFDTDPDIIHFSGHGSSSGSLILEGDDGKAFPVSPEALDSIFSLFSNKLACVILNACYSKIQAEAIAHSIPYVIGMRDRIGDAAAITFSVGFYKALLNHRTIDEAFQFGVAEIQLSALAEESTPILLTNARIRRRLIIASPQEGPYRHPLPPSMTGRACIGVSQDGQRDMPDTFAIIDPNSYATLQELLDELYMKFLIDRFPPYTYGSRWILYAQPWYREALRVVAPPVWAASDRQPVHQVAHGWQQHQLANYDIIPGSSWLVREISNRAEFWGLATNNSRLVHHLERSPKAAWQVFEEFPTIPISVFDESRYTFNCVFENHFSRRSHGGVVHVDPNPDPAAPHLHRRGNAATLDCSAPRVEDRDPIGAY